MAEEVDLKALHSFYKSLSELVGTESMLKIYRHYKGTQLNVPIHLYDRNIAAQRVLAEFDGHNQQDLARTYGYSEKWVKSILRQEKSRRSEPAHPHHKTQSRAVKK